MTPVPFRHVPDIRDPETGRIRAPFRINWTVRENTLCGHRDHGNGVLCDDCWMACILGDDEPVRVAAPRKHQEVSSCQPTLF